jgi:hypothetical protein
MLAVEDLPGLMRVGVKKIGEGNRAIGGNTLARFAQMRTEKKNVFSIDKLFDKWLKGGIGNTSGHAPQFKFVF